MKPSDLKAPTPWLPAPPAAHAGGTSTVWVRGCIGLGAAAAFLALHFKILAVVVASIAGVTTLASLASPAARRGLERALGAFSRLVGRLLSWLVLAPLFLLGFPLVRALHRLSGHDPLNLRPDDAPTFWIPAAEERRRARCVRSLFAAEPIRRGRRWPAVLAGLFVLACLAEITLRIMGFGDPVLYIDDPVVGYYPAPNQAVHRRGEDIRINAFGMRSDPVTAAKPAGTFRVLVLGDSTAFGGTYLDQAVIYTSRLRQALSERAGGRPVEVLNAAVNGWGPFHELGYLDTFGDFDCDLALITLPYGDVFRPLTGLSTKPFPSAAHPPFLALQEVLLHLMWRIREASDGATPEARNDVQGQRGVRAYATLAQRLAAGGADVLVEVLPTPPAGVRSEVRPRERQWVDALTAAVGVPVGFPVGLFAEVPRPYFDFIHLDTAGHARYAEWLADRVSTLSPAYQRFAHP